MKQSNFLGDGVATALATIFIKAAMAPVMGSSVFGQSDQSNVVLLSNRFNSDTFSSEVVGEVLNNGTRPLNKYDVNINAYFYDPGGVLVGSEQGFIDAQTLAPGDGSAFNVFTTDESIMNEAATYDISINDKRVIEHAPIGGDNASEGDDDSSNSENSDDTGNECSD